MACNMNKLRDRESYRIEVPIMDCSKKFRSKESKEHVIGLQDVEDKCEISMTLVV